jgi:hypothetical protein
MVSRFRTAGRRIAGVLVALLIGATALPPALHADMDDLACEFGAARSARATHVDANDSHPDSLHCEVCHWLRSIRVFETAGIGNPQLVATVDAVVVMASDAVTVDVSAPGSSRAPPLS